VVYDNFSTAYFGTLKTTDYGTNSDIVDGRLSADGDKSYVFMLKGREPIIKGTGNQHIILEEAEASFRTLFYLPLYKNVTPRIKFECYLENPRRYIGKIEVEKKAVAWGLTIKGLKKMITEQYINNCVAILNQKAISYDVVHKITPVQTHTATAYAEENSPKLQAILIDYHSEFRRKIPIRQKGQIYTDTILISPTTLKGYPKYEVFTVDKNKKEIAFKSIGNNDNTLYAGTFKLEKWEEEETSYRSFFAEKIK